MDVRLVRMTDLTSAAVPPIGPEDHVRGEGEGLIVYADLGCPHCAAAWARDRRAARRGSPSATSRSPASTRARRPCTRPPRRPALQGQFFAMVDSLYADRGHVDDPHLWERAERLGLDLERFEADRRSDAVAARVRRDFESGIRAGVAGTPAVFRCTVLLSQIENESSEKRMAANRAAGGRTTK